MISVAQGFAGQEQRHHGFESDDTSFEFVWPEWMDDAPCIGLGHLFFPERGPGQQDVIRQARAICAKCPFQAECLEWAMSSNYTTKHGIWAGTTNKQRRLLREQGEGTKLVPELTVTYWTDRENPSNYGRS